MESRVPHGLSRAALGALLLLAACGEAPPADAARQQALVPEAGDAAAEVVRLAAEVRDIADRIADYRATHQARPPRGLADLALDSLTRETARHLATDGDSTRVTVAWRRTEGRTLLACTGGPAILEEALLNAGAYHLACRTARGDTVVAAQEGR